MPHSSSLLLAELSLLQEKEREVVLAISVVTQKKNIEFGTGLIAIIINMYEEEILVNFGSSRYKFSSLTKNIRLTVNELLKLRLFGARLHD